MNEIYLVLCRSNLRDFKAAVELIRECFGAESRGIAPMNMGLLYVTRTPLSEDDMETLGIVPFV